MSSANDKQRQLTDGGGGGDGDEETVVKGPHFGRMGGVADEFGLFDPVGHLGPRVLARRRRAAAVAHDQLTYIVIDPSPSVRIRFLGGRTVP